MSQKTGTGLWMGVLAVLAGTVYAGNAIKSIDTGYTITHMELGKNAGGSFIAGSSYEGTVLMMNYEGKILAEKKLSGYMNHDLWCDDLNGDGNDEVLAANADGSVYCLNGTDGALLWTFKQNDAPMYAVSTIQKGDTTYVVCGGYDTKLNYLSADGQLVKSITTDFTIDKPFTTHGRKPPAGKMVANLLSPVKRADGTEYLAMVGSINSMQSSGSLYLMEPFAEKAFRAEKLKSKKAAGALRVSDLDQDGNEELLIGNSSNISDAGVLYIDPSKPKGEAQLWTPVAKLRKELEGSGYRIVKPVAIREGGANKILALYGARILIFSKSMQLKEAEILAGKYAYNDMRLDAPQNRMILASAQSGGSAVHIIDLNEQSWKSEYAQLDPPGKIAQILSNTAAARKQNQAYQRPESERDPLAVYFVNENYSSADHIAEAIQAKYSSPVFLNSVWMPRVETKDWRKSLDNEEAIKDRDRRRKYELTQEEALAKFEKSLEDNSYGIATWGGHGNDPLFFSLDTLKKVVDLADGRKVVFIYPELEHDDETFAWVLENHIYPLAEYARGRNTSIFVRTKNIFWQGIAHKPLWSRMSSGEFADIFVPSMEETTDKMMDVSVAGRVGFWLSGAVDSWGARAVLDNPSYDRMRQRSHQRLPSHYLRHLIYNIANGARYLNNLAAHPEYESFLWELIATGALYVPERSELLSISPVHLSMKAPDEDYIHEGINVKWLTFYDEQYEKNPRVFSRMNGTWPGAAVTEWDFSRYAAGVQERRLSFLPSYSNGLVLVTPPQKGVFANQKAVRGQLRDHLHPIYKDIMKEYVTDGRDYFSADGKETFAADEYYTTIQKDIVESSKALPLTVSGEVAWVVAQTAPNRLRLTLIDGGYINPSDKTAEVTFHTVKPKQITDLLTKETFALGDSSTVKIEIPCGLFRFIDIELSEPLVGAFSE